MYLSLIPVDHRLVFTLPKGLFLSADDECSIDDEQHFLLQFRFSNGAVANLCPNPEEHVHLHRRHYRNITHSKAKAAAPQFAGVNRKEKEEDEGDDVSGTVIVSDGNRIFIRFSTPENARELFSALPEENPLSLLPVELQYKTGEEKERIWKPFWMQLARRPAVATFCGLFHPH